MSHLRLALLLGSLSALYADPLLTEDIRISARGKVVAELVTIDKNEHTNRPISDQSDKCLPYGVKCEPSRNFY